MARSVQSMFAFGTWGGARRGAGRKPKGERALVAHDTRPALASRFPVHVTARLSAGLPSLRRDATHRALLRCFAAGRERFGFRLVQYSIQSNHLHLIAEARDRDALTRGLQGLLVRVARALNRLWKRRGKVFSDRFHDRILRTPREVRHALAYVLNNARKHGIALAGVDPFGSGAGFDGWREPCAAEGVQPPTARARSWLLATGWRRHGLIGVCEVPGIRRRAGAR